MANNIPFCEITPFGEKEPICCMGVSKDIVGVAEGVKTKLLSPVKRKADMSNIHIENESRINSSMLFIRCLNLLSSEPVIPQANARKGERCFPVVSIKK